MAVPYATPATVSYIGNGLASVFAITFPTFEVTDIEVAVTDANGISTDLAITTDYTLASIGIPGTNASLTLVDAAQAWLITGKLKTGYTLFIRFTPKASQPANLRNLGRFAPEEFGKALDRLTMNILGVKDLAGRALGLHLGDGGSGVLPPLPGNAGRIMQVNSTATGFEYGVTSATIAGYASSASTSATAAASSASAAAGSVTAASTQASGASTSATNAANSATAAATSAANALTAANGAAASQAATSADLLNTTAAKNSASTSATAAANSATAAAASATAASGAAASATAAAGSATNAATSATAAAGSATASASSASASATSVTASANSATASNTAKVAAEAARDITLTYENQAELWANRSLYKRIVTLTVANSPYTIDKDIEQDVLFIVDSTGGNVNINLPLISTTSDHIGWKVGFIRKSVTPNAITIIPNTTDTINLLASFTVNDPRLGAVVYAGSPTNWAGRLYTDAAIAADALPPGGNAGDILIKNSTVAGDAAWKTDTSIINALIFG